jgi:hypothetical protein
MIKRQHCRLPAQGAAFAASSISYKTGSGILLGRNFLIDLLDLMQSIVSIARIYWAMVAYKYFEPD